MILLRLSHLTTFSAILILALTHPLTNRIKQQTDITAVQTHTSPQPSPSLPDPLPRIQLLSRQNQIVEGYRLSLSQYVQILPISIAASELRDFWNGVMVAADAKWQSDDRVLPVSFGRLQIVFESGDANVPLDWTAIVFLASYMKDMVGVGGGWAGFFRGTMTSLATQAVIRVTLGYVGQGV